MSWLPTVLHLLQGDPKHSGRAEGVAEGSREALPHRLHSLAASVRLHRDGENKVTSAGRLVTSLYKHAIMGGARTRTSNSGQQEQNKLKIGAGPLPSRKRTFLSCVSVEMRRA